jgi:hypothetical protein
MLQNSFCILIGFASNETLKIRLKFIYNKLSKFILTSCFTLWENLHGFTIKIQIATISIGTTEHDDGCKLKTMTLARFVLACPCSQFFKLFVSCIIRLNSVQELKRESQDLNMNYSETHSKRQHVVQMVFF